MFALLSASVGGFCGCRCSRNWAWLLRGKYACLRVTVTCYLLPVPVPVPGQFCLDVCGFIISSCGTLHTI